MLHRLALPLAALCLMAPVALAQDEPEDAVNIELVQRVLTDRRSTERALAGLELATETQAYQMALQYSGVAKGYWLNIQCKFVEGVEKQEYERQIALFTNIVGTLLMEDGGLGMEDAGERTKALQIAARDEMAMNQFLGCGPEAAAVVAETVQAAGRVMLREGDEPSS